ncbi:MULTISPECIES: hypothetical protein [Actinobacillus]|uniref:Uncharacterized protein n=3 Tax=Actinobacillus TaxID=713 RepID=K0G3R8_ACTSU|nr:MULTISPECIES: hypothetical protein [Actinobacillus]AFU18788.1 hypothetical protein ASU2_03240 [Actinobacillus suis H91-0380]AIJ30866.1 hypothetical protein ASU1_02970 [Actinobacillus suis ATCC 33415]MCO4166991.1 hypothetical protein [Actinobacillus suis]MCO4168357.1 hypothetical protein [Actinobacillus suis]MCQ9628999.1 hypothetical protein [Actinobacillus suis]
MMTRSPREVAVIKALVTNPHLGISEKESYFDVHFLNARNEVNRVEKQLGLEFNRVSETSKWGNPYTRYTVKDAEQIKKLVEYHNHKVRTGKARGSTRKIYENVEEISDQQLSNILKLWGK